jgi:hypothetical protein
VVRHRLSRAGDRMLNHALYMMAIVQIRHPTSGQAYYRRKRAEGKSPKEALRCLKRDACRTLCTGACSPISGSSRTRRSRPADHLAGERLEDIST